MAQIGKAIDGLWTVVDVHNIGPHYDKTLVAWYENFDAKWTKPQHARGERFYRMWKYYLLCCAGGFRARALQVWQFVLSPTGVPKATCSPADPATLDRNGGGHEQSFLSEGGLRCVCLPFSSRSRRCCRSPAFAAETKLSGTFVASQACAAVQSIKKQTNPGNVHLTPGTSYKLLAGNNEPPTHYWIVVPGAQPDYRWVPVSCGTIERHHQVRHRHHLRRAAGQHHDASCDTTTSATPPAATGKADYVLAISWEPAFCEGLPDKTECKKRDSDLVRGDASVSARPLAAATQQGLLQRLADRPGERQGA